MKNKYLIASAGIFVVILVIGVFIYIKNKPVYINYEGNKMKATTINISNSIDTTYTIPEMKADNGQIYLLKVNGKHSISLKKNDRIQFSFDIKTDNQDSCVAGYFIGNKHVEIISISVKNKAKTNFIVPESGDYTFYFLGASANITHILRGKILIN